MQTTLMDGDRLVLTKMGYKPQHGDIIVLDSHYKSREAYIAMQKEKKGRQFRLVRRVSAALAAVGAEKARD